MELSERSLGWLRYIDGTRQVDHGDACAIALGLMARRTPAWTERFVVALDRLIEFRFQRGDATLPSGPPAASTWPAAAELLLLLGVRAMIDGDDRWNRPAELERLGLPAESATHRALAEAVAAAWPEPTHAPPSTPHAWQGALACGLGLLLHDRRHGGARHEATFAPWWAAHGAALPPLGFAAALYLAPQAPDAARRLFDERWQALGWHRPPSLPLADDDEAAIAALLARHWDLAEHTARLRDAIDASYPSCADDEQRTFGWAPPAPANPAAPPAAGHDPAPSPRLSAWLAAADATGAGHWSALCAAPLPAQPQVVDTDFPTFALRRAEWNAGFLTMRFAPRREDRSVRTTFRLVGAEPRIWCVGGINDITMDVTARDVVVRAPVVEGTVEFAPGSY